MTTRSSILASDRWGVDSVEVGSQTQPDGPDELPAPPGVGPRDPPSKSPEEPEDSSLYGRHGHIVTERRVDGLTREQICYRYQRRILLVARRLNERLPPDCELDMEDLVSFGAIGLLEAFDRYDSGRNILFSTFAEYRIRGAMMDALRQTDSFTRYRRQMSRRIGDVTRALTAELGRLPEAEEIAAHLGMELEAYWQVADRIIPVTHVSLDAQIDPEGGEGGRSLAETIEGSDGQEPFRNILGQQVRVRLREALLALPDKQKQCVLLYYGRGLNLAEVAAVFEVTPSRISQVLSAARKCLRTALDTEVDAEDLGEWASTREAL